MLLQSGCVQLTGDPTLSQVGIGPIVYRATGCAEAVGSTCPPPDSHVGTSTNPGQMLVALKVPLDYPLPATFTFEGATTPVFRPSPTYTSELERLTPAEAGRTWAGYISDLSTFTPGGTGALAFTFDRPAPAGGSPRARAVPVMIVLGARTGTVANGGDSARPVSCGATANDLTGFADGTVCKDASFDLTGVGRDLALTAGAPVTVVPGATANVRITARYAGTADPSVNFSLSARTTVPRATALPSVAAFAPPADSVSKVSLSVAVPASTPPGTYGVTLTARLASGQVRTAAATIVVAAPCAGKRATIAGTAGPDTLRGTAGDDVIAGRGGADVISGLGGDDVICGDAGADRISGGAGRDRILGGPGPDRLSGGPGRDVLAGGPGDDLLTGGGALDVITGGPGVNVIAQ